MSSQNYFNVHVCQNVQDESVLINLNFFNICKRMRSENFEI